MAKNEKGKQTNNSTHDTTQKTKEYAAQTTYGSAYIIWLLLDNVQLYHAINVVKCRAVIFGQLG